MRIKYHSASRYSYRLICCLWLFLSLLFPAPTQAQSGAIARCKGHGSVLFEGSGTVSINGEGVLIVSDNASVAFFMVGDVGGKEPTEAPECLPSGNGYCIYTGSDLNAPLAGQGGKAEVSGTGIRVAFSGSNIGLTAQGEGKLVLKGYGIYLYDKTIGRWAADRTGSVIYLQP